jgi:hypothetical protein
LGAWVLGVLPAWPPRLAAGYRERRSLPRRLTRRRAPSCCPALAGIRWLTGAVTCSRAIARRAADRATARGTAAYQRVWTADDRLAAAERANIRVRDLGTGRYINVTAAEETAFWEFAAVEVLRHPGIRIEELLELTHLSIWQCQPCSPRPLKVRPWSRDSDT